MFCGITQTVCLSMKQKNFSLNIFTAHKSERKASCRCFQRENYFLHKMKMEKIMTVNKHQHTLIDLKITTEHKTSL